MKGYFMGLMRHTGVVIEPTVGSGKPGRSIPAEAGSGEPFAVEEHRSIDTGSQAADGANGWVAEGAEVVDPGTGEAGAQVHADANHEASVKRSMRRPSKQEQYHALDRDEATLHVSYHDRSALPSSGYDRSVDVPTTSKGHIGPAGEASLEAGIVPASGVRKTGEQKGISEGSRRALSRSAEAWDAELEGGTEPQSDNIFGDVLRGQENTGVMILEKVRAWVADVPYAEVDREMGDIELKVRAEDQQPSSSAAISHESLEKQQTREVQRPTLEVQDEELHLSIGSIHLTIEETNDRASTGGDFQITEGPVSETVRESSRLRRHYLRIH